MKLKNFKSFFRDRKINSICDQYGIKKFNINSDGSIDVFQDVYLSDYSLTKLPLKFRKVTGDFNCSENKIKTLDGSPTEVDGDFNCSSNLLTTLEGGPKKVGGKFCCNSNKLTTLKGSPIMVGGNFYCAANKLTTLEGSPIEILGSEFNARYNILKSLKGFPEKYGHRRADVLVDLYGNPIWDIFDRIVMRKFPYSNPLSFPKFIQNINKLGIIESNYSEKIEDINKELISIICDKYKIKNWTLNSDGTIDVDGNVNLDQLNLEVIPLKFGKVSGYFNCSRNRLTTLEGAPKEVGGDFDCYLNKLYTLYGCPETIGGNFNCSSNQISTSSYFPKEIGKFILISSNLLNRLPSIQEEVFGDFDCSNNRLTSLDGCPKIVNGSFACAKNYFLKTLKGGPKEVRGYLFDCSNNKIESLEGGPKIVSGSYRAVENNIKSFEGIPDDWEGFINFSGNPVQKILDQFPVGMINNAKTQSKIIYWINEYEVIWQGEVIPERLEMVKDKLGL